MRFSPRVVKPQIVGAVGLLSMVALVGCSSAPTGLSPNDMAGQTLESAAVPESGSTDVTADSSNNSIPTSNFETRTQLTKSATLSLEMADVDAAIASVSDILAQHQGDLLQLSDAGEQDHLPRQIDLRLRVPQANLESTLQALKELGNVTQQSIAANDISSQLGDFQARVRNLRKSDVSLLESMVRSGSIAEVLEVSRELSVVREAIERNDAQLKVLQNQVAYSTIALSLMSNLPVEPTPSPIGETLGQTWQAASFSMQALSVGLLQVLLWLLAFSPYIGLVLLSSWVGRRYWQRQRSPETPANSN